MAASLATVVLNLLKHYTKLRSDICIIPLEWRRAWFEKLVVKMEVKLGTRTFFVPEAPLLSWSPWDFNPNAVLQNVVFGISNLFFIIKPLLHWKTNSSHLEGSSKCPCVLWFSTIVSNVILNNYSNWLSHDNHDSCSLKVSALLSFVCLFLLMKGKLVFD